MVDWFINFEDTEVKVNTGKLVMATPCSLDFQKDLVKELQKKKPRFKVQDSEHNSYKEDTPILMIKQLIHLDAAELKDHFEWWSQQLNLKFQESDPYFDLLPKRETGWSDLKIEKRIALFLGAAIKSSTFSYAFFGDIHLDQNAQTFLFNFLKNISQTSQHQAMIFWTYRTQIPQTTALYFKGFGKNAA